MHARSAHSNGPLEVPSDVLMPRVEPHSIQPSKTYVWVLKSAVEDLVEAEAHRLATVADLQLARSAVL